MTFTIDLPNASPLDAIKTKLAIEKLAINITAENLAFLADLSDKKDINKKIQSKKMIIKNLI
jgi:hypothetical protein